MKNFRVPWEFVKWIPAATLPEELELVQVSSKPKNKYARKEGGLMCIYFCCHAIRFECPFQLQVWYPAASGENGDLQLRLSTRAAHNAHEELPGSRFIALETKEKLKFASKLGLKPTKVCQEVDVLTV